MMLVEDLMTTELLTLGSDASLADAALIMRENRVRHVPILNAERELLGLITQRDLLAAAPEMQTLVGSIMREKLYTTVPDESLRAAALTMQRYRVGCLPVVADGRLKGIVTDTDYVALAINLLELQEDEEPPSLADDDGDI